MATLNKDDKDFLPRKSAANLSEGKIPKPKDIIPDKTKDITTQIFINENITSIIDKR